MPWVKYYSNSSLPPNNHSSAIAAIWQDKPDSLRWLHESLFASSLTQVSFSGRCYTLVERVEHATPPISIFSMRHAPGTNKSFYCADLRFKALAIAQNGAHPYGSISRSLFLVLSSTNCIAWTPPAKQAQASDSLCVAENNMDNFGCIPVERARGLSDVL